MELEKVYSIKAGDTLPDIEIEAFDRHGEPLNLDGFAATISIAEEIGARPIARGPATINGNTIRYKWKPGETDCPGEYLLEVIFTGIVNSDLQFTIPGGSYGTVIITPRL